VLFIRVTRGNIVAIWAFATALTDVWHADMTPCATYPVSVYTAPNPD
jgi:hypothetical protein